MLYAIDMLQKTTTVGIPNRHFLAPRLDTRNVSVFAKPWIRQCRLLRGFTRRHEFITLNNSLLKSTTGCSSC